MVFSPVKNEWQRSHTYNLTQPTFGFFFQKVFRMFIRFWTTYARTYLTYAQPVSQPVKPSGSVKKCLDMKTFKSLAIISPTFYSRTIEKGERTFCTHHWRTLWHHLWNIACWRKKNILSWSKHNTKCCNNPSQHFDICISWNWDLKLHRKGTWWCIHIPSGKL